MEERE